MKEIGGIVCAMVTPMNSYGNIHEPGICQLTERSIQCGVHGLFSIGTTGEFYAMTQEEKVKVTQIVIRQASGRVPVYAGCGAESTREVIELIKRMESIGVDAVSVVTPYFITPSQIELYHHYEAIAKSTRLPVIIYNIPPRAGVNIDAATVGELSKIDNIVGIKDSSGKIDNIKSYIDATKDKDFSVLAGTDSLILSALELGAKGAIAATANVVPQVVVGIYENFLKGDRKTALDFQGKLVPLRSAFSLGTIPSILKETTCLIGIDAGPPRSPLMRPSPEVMDKLVKIVEEEYEIYKAVQGPEAFAV